VTRFLSELSVLLSLRSKKEGAKGESQRNIGRIGVTPADISILVIFQ
jgi:hypothetical protein